MESRFNCDNPDIDDRAIYHNHAERISEKDKWGYFKNDDNLRNEIDHHKHKLQSCMTFFKTLSKNTKDPKEKARAKAILKEDKERLKDFQKIRPKKHGCFG